MGRPGLPGERGLQGPVGEEGPKVIIKTIYTYMQNGSSTVCYHMHICRVFRGLQEMQEAEGVLEML